MKQCYLQTINPPPTPGLPAQQGEECTAERKSQPLSTEATPCLGGQSWARRLSESSSRKNSTPNSVTPTEDDFITASTSHHPPQHQPQHLTPGPSILAAERPRCLHQSIIPSWPISLDPQFCSSLHQLSINQECHSPTTPCPKWDSGATVCFLFNASTDKARKAHPDV